MSLQAQIACPPPDGSGSGQDYGTACHPPLVLLGGRITPFSSNGNQVPGDASGSPNRLLTSAGQPYPAGRLDDAQLQALRAAARTNLDRQTGDLARYFIGAMLDYRGAAEQFIGRVVRDTEAPRDDFLRIVLLAPDDRDSVLGLLDAMELLAQRWMVKGNEELANALYKRYQETSFDLFQVNEGLRTADQSFRKAVAVYMADFYRPLPRTALTLYDLVMQYQLNRRDATNIGFRDMRLLARAAGRKAFTQRELGQRLFALGRIGEAFDVLNQEELEIMGELALIAAVYDAITPEMPEARIAVNESLRELLAERSKITTLLRYLEGGKNVLGLDNDYVEFRFNREIHDPDRQTNFTQVREWATSKLADAERSYAAFRTQSRQFEQSVTAYQSRLQQHLDYYNRELFDLCGSVDPPDPTNCTGGLVRRARLDVDQANLRIEAVLQDISNLQRRITNMIEASDAIRAVRDQVAKMEIANGEQRATLTQELARLQADAARERTELEARRQSQQGDQLAGRTAGDAARAGGRIDETLIRQTGERQAQMERLAALQRADFTRAEDRARAVEVRRFVQDTTLEILSKRIELRMAQLTLTQATATLEDRTQQLRRSLAERQTWRGLDGAGEPILRDPTLRIIRDESLKRYMSDYEEALRRVFLAGRALAYEVNACPGVNCPPEIINLDRLLQIVSPAELRSKLTEMDERRVDFESRFRTERRRIVIELSKLLGFRSRLLRGQARNARQQLQDCLRPQVDGTEPPPECPRFDVRDSGRTVIFNFPIEIGLHLQNPGNPDFAPILPAGFANVRIRSIKAIIEGPPPVSGQFADLPLSYGLTDPSGNLVGDMIQRGPDSNISFLDSAGRDQIRRYNAFGAGTATLPAAVGVSTDFDRVTASSDKFIYRTLGFSNYILILSVDPQRFPRNPGLIGPLSNVEDITFEFTCDAYTLPIQ